MDFASTKMIVADIPSQQRAIDRDVVGGMPTAFPRPGAVRFSFKTKLNCVDLPSQQEKDILWYSDKDISYFRKILAGDSKRMGAKLVTAPAGAITRDDLYVCLGVENLLSFDLAWHATMKKRAHVVTILTWQHTCNDEELRRVSEASSQWARERANKLAAEYWSMKDA